MSHTVTRTQNLFYYTKSTFSIFLLPPEVWGAVCVKTNFLHDLWCSMHYAYYAYLVNVSGCLLNARDV